MTYVSSIPPEAEGVQVSEYRRDGGLVSCGTVECRLDGEIVGYRFHDEDGSLVTETPIKNGLKHGVEYQWANGVLISAEPHENGKIHGTATQYGRDGRVIGTYEIVRGTGYDVWRQEREDGTVFVSEIHPMKDGLPHGIEWWVNDDQRSVHVERHWFEGKRHGIEREWNPEGRLRRGWPKYFVNDEQVTRRGYVRAMRTDLSLPAIRPEDNLPGRDFPMDVRKFLS